MASPIVISRFKSRFITSVQRTRKINNAVWAQNTFRTGSIALLVAVGYCAATEVGFIFTPPGSPISAFWPPNSLLLATLLLAPRRIWWILLLAVLPAHLLIQMHSGVPPATASGWFIGNASEALLGALCISHFKKQASLFDSIRGVTVFLVFGVFLAPLLTSFLDAAVVLVTGLGRHYWELWTIRLFSNMLAELTIAPVIVLFVPNGIAWLRKAGASRHIEAVLLAVGIYLTSMFIFGGEVGWRANTPALMYAPLPFLLWASVRFGSSGLHSSLLTIALISIWHAMHGRDPFISASARQNVLTLQILLCTIAVPLMLLSAFIHEVRQTGSKVVDALEEERRRIARELHDDVGQQLTLVQLELEELRDESDSAQKSRLGKVYDQVSEIFKTTREISHGLHPSYVEHVGIAAALRRLCTEITAEKSVKINFIDENLPPQLPVHISLCLYRVAQGALQNVVQHSHADSITVELTANLERVLLRIADNGAGFDLQPEGTTGLGLASMRERVRSVGGKIELTSAPMKGTKIEASVPLDPLNKAKSLPSNLEFFS